MTTVLFEKNIEEFKMQVLFTSELRMGSKTFHVNHFTRLVVPDEKNPNIMAWIYENELILYIKKCIEIIEKKIIIDLGDTFYRKHKALEKK
jgi:hypothetical protein